MEMDISQWSAPSAIITHLMQRDSLKKLQKVVAHLMGPRGCPWDRVQTHKSLKPYLLEETYEVLEAIDHGDAEKLKEELGDLLLQVYMHGELARKKRTFTIHDVANNLSAKLTRRHPHVFGGKRVKGAADAWRSWEKIKATETGGGKGKTGSRSHMDGIPKALPALARADKAQRKASRVGFDWDRVAGAWEKVYEEIDEIEEALKKRDKRKNRMALREELGDLMFAIVNVARKLDFHAEELLQQATDKFIRRFREIERHLGKRGRPLSDYSSTELDLAWERAKEMQ